MLLVLFTACLIDRANYDRRLAELTDADGDGFAAEHDCDDGDAAISPGAIEGCDGVDEDCDGEVDDGATDAVPWYGDADGDGFGLASVVVTACNPPTGYAANGTDCDDGNASKNPEASETPYDGVDQDCSGADLEDVDGDGAAAEAAGGEDCDDGDPTIHPSAPETWADGFTDNDYLAGNEGVREEYGGEAFTGRIAGGRAGGNLAALGDLNADGRPEFAVAAFYDSTLANNGGAVFIVDSAVPQPLVNFSAIETTIDSAFLGTAIDAGDADGDGAPELLVAASGYDDAHGLAVLVDAAALTVGARHDLLDVAAGGIRGPHPGAYLGSRVAFLPDSDGDGLSELGCTAPLADVEDLDSAGAVYVFAAEDILEAGAIVSVETASQRLVGSTAGDIAGNGLNPAGDQDGDGLDDLLVYDGVDELWMVPGGTGSGALDDIATVRIVDAIADSRVLEDVDGDGRRDVIVLGTQAYVVADLTAQPVWVPQEAYASIDTDGDLLSDAISLGDRTGDGASETVLFVTERASLSTGWAGVVPSPAWSYGTELGYEDFDLEAVSTRPSAGFGFHAENIGNIGGDAADYFAVGGWLDDEGGTDAGAVALLRIPG